MVLENNDLVREAVELGTKANKRLDLAFPWMKDAEDAETAENEFRTIHNFDMLIELNNLFEKDFAKKNLYVSIYYLIISQLL